MKNFLILVSLLIIFVFSNLYSHNLGLKDGQLIAQESIDKKNSKIQAQLEGEAKQADEVSRVYGSKYSFFINEAEKMDWRMYTNKDLGVSFWIPVYCGEPEINKYYKHIDQAKIVQGTFPQNCPIKSFSAKMPDVSTDNDDISFGKYKTRIKDTELNTQNMKGIRAFVMNADLFSEISGFQMNDILFTFNLKSSKYPTVTFYGKADEPFRKAMNSIEIK